MVLVASEEDVVLRAPPHLWVVYEPAFQARPGDALTLCDAGATHVALFTVSEVTTILQAPACEYIRIVQPNGYRPW